MTVGKVPHNFGTDPKIDYCIHKFKNHMTYTVHCPALNETEVCYSQEHAIDVCLSMHNESGAYAYVEDYLGHTVAEYGDIVEGIADMLFA